MTLYQCVLIFKFLAIMLFAGGVLAAFLSDDIAIRKRAAHRIASPALLAVWIAGYVLLELTRLPLLELWVVASLVLSMVANAALALAVSRGRRDFGAVLWVCAPIVVVVVLMVSKLRWAEVLR